MSPWFPLHFQREDGAPPTGAPHNPWGGGLCRQRTACAVHTRALSDCGPRRASCRPGHPCSCPLPSAGWRSTHLPPDSHGHPCTLSWFLVPPPASAPQTPPGSARHWVAPVELLLFLPPRDVTEGACEAAWRLLLKPGPELTTHHISTQTSACRLNQHGSKCQGACKEKPMRTVTLRR